MALWRRAWRDKVLPALARFEPDFIFISAGFDAHRKDHLNHRYIGVHERDYEWVTKEIMKVLRLLKDHKCMFLVACLRAPLIRIA